MARLWVVSMLVVSAMCAVSEPAHANGFGPRRNRPGWTGNSRRFSPHHPIGRTRPRPAPRPLEFETFEPFNRYHPMAGSFVTKIVGRGVNAVVVPYANIEDLATARLHANRAIQHDGPLVIGETRTPDGRPAMVIEHVGMVIAPKNWRKLGLSRPNIAAIYRTLEKLAVEFPTYADQVVLQKKQHDGETWFDVRVLPWRPDMKPRHNSIDHFMAEALAR